MCRHGEEDVYSNNERRRCKDEMSYLNETIELIERFVWLFGDLAELLLRSPKL
jgi:hypothetical protein